MYEETKLSVIIVNYNVKYFLEQCLRSVRAATVGMDVEVFVVDNHSTDGSIDYLRPRFPEVTFIENSGNQGFAKANNQAIRLCSGEYVLLLNPDTVVGEESLRTLCYQMDEDLTIGAIGVKMLNGHGVFLPESKRSFPSPWVSFCKLFGLSRFFQRSSLFARYSLPYLDCDKSHEVEVLAGAFMLLRHEALDKIGITLVDFKVEFGKNSKGEILLADEITPDTCRFWDKETGKKLDKDRFRRDLGSIEEAYIEVLNRLNNL